MAQRIENMLQWLREHRDRDCTDGEGRYWVPMVALKRFASTPHDEWVTICGDVQNSIKDIAEDANVACWVVQEYNDCDKCEYFGIGWGEGPEDDADDHEDDDE
jgi:hypothetical protein